MKCLGKCLALVALMTVALSAQAEQLFMVRSTQPFPEAMNLLQSALTEHGYTIARVQRVDLGLTGNGFKTDKYRVVFFGKPKEVRELTRRYPQLIPYLPWPITVFAERDQTLMVTANPSELQALDTNPEVHKYLLRWTRDLRDVFDEVRNAN